MEAEDPNHRFDALLPPEMAARAEQVGVRKAGASVRELIALSVLAGAFISLGADFSTAVAAGADGVIPYGVKQLLAGVVFSLGLVLVIVGGAELFTGNNMIVMAWASGKVSTPRLLRNWAIVYAGNFFGAIATAGLVFLTRQYTFGSGSVGAVVLASASAKTSLEFTQAIALGVLCNALVCLAVWLAYSARSTADRVIAIVPPVAAFVACGFEHCIANMYLIPLALFIKAAAPASFWAAIGRSPASYPNLTCENFFLANLLPVTIGNILGGGVLVACVYWFVYLRKRD